MSDQGFSAKRSNEIAEATFRLSRWFKASGVERPNEFMELLALIVVAEDQTLTPAKIAHGQEIARRHDAAPPEPRRLGSDQQDIGKIRQG
jgi:hypothetical protein